MKWVSRGRPPIDRVACAWLIRRFLDPEPEFLFVPNDLVDSMAERENATIFHVRQSRPHAGGNRLRSADSLFQHRSG
jgi:hypothetical protein